jgi:hypothetical protein
MTVSRIEKENREMKGEILSLLKWTEIESEQGSIS